MGASRSNSKSVPSRMEWWNPDAARKSDDCHGLLNSGETHCLPLRTCGLGRRHHSRAVWVRSDRKFRSEVQRRWSTICWLLRLQNLRYADLCSLAERAHAHQIGSAGDNCIACHMPRIEQTIAVVNVRSHTFRFISPAISDKYKIPNPCTDCHKNKSTGWATEQLRAWSNISPWRIDQ